MPFCAVPGCFSNSSEEKYADVTFHRFPKQQHLRQKWAIDVAGKDWQPPKNAHICSNHFAEADSDQTSLSCVGITENITPSSFSDILINKVSKNITSQPNTFIINVVEPKDEKLPPAVDGSENVSDIKSEPDGLVSVSNLYENGSDVEADIPNMPEADIRQKHTEIKPWASGLPIEVAEIEVASYICLLCERHFKSKKVYETHLVKHSKEPASYCCHICNATLKNKKSLQNHLRRGTHKPKLVVQRNRVSSADGDAPPVSGSEDVIKSATTDSSAQYKAPVTHPRKQPIQNIRKTFKCVFCNKGFKSKSVLSVHRARNQCQLGCEDCGKTFKSKSSLKNHTKCIHQKLKPHVCEVCNKAFYFKNGLIHHMSVHTGDKPYTCGECGQSFPRKNQMKIHATVHTQTKRFVCIHCGKKIRLFSNVKKHERSCSAKTERSHNHFTEEELSYIEETTSATTGKRVYECRACKKQYTNHTYLKTHIRNHTGERPYLCEICNKRYISKHSLETHLKIHSDRPKRFACSFCDMTFHQQQNFQRHERWHQGIKPYVCKYCGKELSQLTHLRLHERIHEGIKNHICSICGSAHSTKNNLRQHMWVHSWDNMVTCDICQKSFRHKYRLSTHISKVHLKDIDEPIVVVVTD